MIGEFFRDNSSHHPWQLESFASLRHAWLFARAIVCHKFLKFLNLTTEKFKSDVIYTAHDTSGVEFFHNLGVDSKNVKCSRTLLAYLYSVEHRLDCTSFVKFLCSFNIVGEILEDFAKD